jgi:hypothetical protein
MNVDYYFTSYDANPYSPWRCGDIAYACHPPHMYMADNAEKNQYCCPSGSTAACVTESRPCDDDSTSTSSSDHRCSSTARRCCCAIMQEVFPSGPGT